METTDHRIIHDASIPPRITVIRPHVAPGGKTLSEPASSFAKLSDFEDVSSPETSRSVPLKIPVLDSICFAASLREAGIHIEERHIERFYHALHRQCYPNLQDFVKRSNDSAVGGKNEERLPPIMLSFLFDMADNYVTTISSVSGTAISKSRKAIKLSIQLVDGESVETIVSINSLKGSSEASVAISSQVGSSVECIHSRSAKYIRNLSATEIVEQVVHAARALSTEMIPICNVAFMGSGEPLHNYQSVLVACRFLERIFRLKKGRITISTVGITPRIHDLRRDLPGIILAVYVHAPTNELRKAILPGHKYGLVGLFEALDQYMSKNEHDVSSKRYETLPRRRTVMIEYIMVSGRTSMLECAHELGRLCWRRNLVVNLLPLLPSSAGDNLRHPSVDEMNLFKYVVSSYDVNCTIRFALGSDIQQSRVIQAGHILGLGALPKPNAILRVKDSTSVKPFRAMPGPSRKETPRKQRRVGKTESGFGYKYTSDVTRCLRTVPEESDTRSDGDLDMAVSDGFQSQPMEVFCGTNDEMDFEAYLHLPDSPPRQGRSCRLQRERTASATNSLLDYPSFMAAVNLTGNSHLKAKHASAFHRALHLLGYPPMDLFAQMYETSKLGPVARMRLKNRIPSKVLEFVKDPLNRFVTLMSTVCSVKSSADNKAIRLYIRLNGDCIVETLVTICDFAANQCADVSISAQCSSRFGISKNYNLKPFEMIEQLVHASQLLRSVDESPITIRRVSLEEGGEPLLNYGNVVAACLSMSDRRIWDIDARCITILTMGITPRIFELTRDLPDITIAVDLIAPTQELRESLVPLARRYSLDGLLEAINNHMEGRSSHAKLPLTGEDKVMFQYTMIDNETSKFQHAHELGKLCKDHRLRANLVPYQRQSIEDRGRCPSMSHIHKFMAIVKSYGVNCAVKVPRGASVVDTAREFVVRAEGWSASGKIDLRYIGNSKSQIDFWATLASVRNKCGRKKSNPRIEAEATGSAAADGNFALAVNTELEKGLITERCILALDPNGVALMDACLTSRSSDTSCACDDVALKVESLVLDPLNQPVVYSPELACERGADSSCQTERENYFDYASDDILQQDNDAFKSGSCLLEYTDTEHGLANYGQPHELRGERSDRNLCQLSTIFENGEDAEGFDLASDADFDAADGTCYDIGESDSECCNDMQIWRCENSGALDAIHKDLKSHDPNSDVNWPCVPCLGGHYSSRIEDVNDDDDDDDDCLDMTGSGKQHGAECDYRINNTSDEDCNASEGALSIDTPAPYAVAKRLQIFACPAGAIEPTDPAGTPFASVLECGNNAGIPHEATIRVDPSNVSLCDASWMKAGVEVALKTGSSNLHDSVLRGSGCSTRSFVSAWEVVANSGEHDDRPPCHLPGPMSSKPGASIVSTFDVLYGFWPVPTGGNRTGDSRESMES